MIGNLNLKNEVFTFKVMYSILCTNTFNIGRFKYNLEESSNLKQICKIQNYHSVDSISVVVLFRFHPQGIKS